MQKPHESFVDVGPTADADKPVFAFPPAPFSADEGMLNFTDLPYSEEWFMARGEEF